MHAWSGAICGRGAFIGALMDLHLGPVMLLGPTMDPAIASQLSLRLPHLGLRMAEHARRALAYAARLQQARCSAHASSVPASCGDTKPPCISSAALVAPPHTCGGLQARTGGAVCRIQ